MPLKDVISLISKKFDISGEEAEKIVDKAVAGGEVVKDGDYEGWYKNRFLPNCVLIDETGYSKMVITKRLVINFSAFFRKPNSVIPAKAGIHKGLTSA
ncbi:hypothetical protein OMAG_000567 [Candidatus Omnitrophus magneticus]|uniref:Uncharacterized protein n=1 Tax=Candidatus Omnitrophus magneticus TaxID=1609969 RepID=A0A0F0CQK4_9BACT|nr:hypothetical protein OMAG_000567 [Candidatus Omnitrophus magneticus]